eukprot:TRINITY_DN4621_c0_g1_i3.p1 TRINITY_DN4621_c0_g1~~TRINITY_DN4621_c0_g1_i3.p1  ORF type:complete len:183 (+),score=33.69 TRINITY_DN4621_c0_g1_i3:62-610(+)
MKNLNGVNRISSLLGMLSNPVLKPTSSLPSAPQDLSSAKPKRLSVKASPQKTKTTGRNYFPLFTDQVQQVRSESKQGKRDTSFKTAETKEEAKTQSVASLPFFESPNKVVKGEKKASSRPRASVNGKPDRDLARSSSIGKKPLTRPAKSPMKDKAISPMKKVETLERETQTDPIPLLSLLVL